MGTTAGDVNSFVVRIWVEERDKQGLPIDWRGTIEHVQSGKKEYFDSLTQALQFMQDRTGWRSTAGNLGNRVNK